MLPLGLHMILEQNVLRALRVAILALLKIEKQHTRLVVMEAKELWMWDKSSSSSCTFNLKLRQKLCPAPSCASSMDNA